MRTVLALVVVTGLSCGRTDLLDDTVAQASTSTSAAPLEGVLVVSTLRNWPFRDTRGFVFAVFGPPPVERIGGRAEFEPFGCALTSTPRLDGGTVSAGALALPSGERATRSEGVYALVVGDGGVQPAPLTVSFSGDEVPAFTASIPVIDDPTLEVSGLTCGATSCGPILRAAPLTLRWTPARGDVVLRAFSAGRELVCRFPGGLGEATVPATLLQQLPPGRGGLEAGSFLSTSMRAGDVPVTVRRYGQWVSESFIDFR